MSDVAKIADELTPQQRAAVLSSSTEWKRLWGKGTGAYKGVKVRDFFEYDGWYGPQGNWQHSVRLTPLGEAVRKHLEQNP